MTGIKDYEYKDFNLWMINLVVAVGKFFAVTLVAPEIAVPIQIAAAGTELAVEGWKSLPTDSPAFRGTYQYMLFEVTNVAWEKTFDKFERLDLSKKCREEMKGAFILWDKSKCVELVQKGKKPLGMVERGILAALRRWEEDKERKLQNKYFATEEQMVVTAREMTRTLFVNLKERIEEKPELKALLDREEIERLVNNVLQLQDRVIEDLKKLGIKIDDIDKTIELLKEESGNHGSKLDKLENTLAKLLEYILEDRQDSRECMALFEEFRALINMLLEEIKALRETQGREYEKTLEKKPAENLDLLVEKNSIRRLSDNLWVNWETGVLATDFESALDRQTAYSGSPSSVASSSAGRYSYKKLDRHQLRLLSILVQGEGAKVSWEELEKRRKVRLDDEQSGFYGEEGLHGDSYETEYETEHETDRDAFPEDVEDAVRQLQHVDEGLASIIKVSEKGCAIALYEPDPRREDTDLYAGLPGCSEEEDWRSAGAKNSDGESEDSQAWVRCYYRTLCHSFENNVSNARYEDSNVTDVFGNYHMAQVYMNSYAVPKYADEPTVMLDFIEEWFSGRDKIGKPQEYMVMSRINGRLPAEKQFGRVLVLHGQPGDGKTTFCKKAVYAHCKEGWLVQASHVLRFSLNPTESKGIVKDGDLDFRAALCQRHEEKPYRCKSDILKGALVILDGYDELSSSLSKVAGANTFWKFCVNYAKKLAQECKCNVIITSRTMCIESELRGENFIRNSEPIVAKFAPLGEAQQDAMIERMIELDRKKGIEADAAGKMSLSKYHKVLKKIRERDKAQKDKKKKATLSELLQIPSLFRMIVAARFDQYSASATRAELYELLFHQLMTLRTETNDETVDEKSLIQDYEEIAVRIFRFDDDTCPFGREERKKNRKLTYLFLTKNDAEKEEELGDGGIEGENGEGRPEDRYYDEEQGRLGFLHRSFYQYFLARSIVTYLKQGAFEPSADKKPTDSDDGGRRDKHRNCRYLSTCLQPRRIDDPDMWQLVTQIAKREGVGRSQISRLIDYLDEEEMFPKRVLDKPAYEEGSDGETSGMLAAENSFFNMLSVAAAVERAYSDQADRSGGSGKSATERTVTVVKHGRPNICRLLRRGDFAGINLAGLKMDHCELQNASLQGAHLDGIYLRGADLTRANLMGADLTGAHLEEARLSGANLSGAILERAHLEDAILDGTINKDTDNKKPYADKKKEAESSDKGNNDDKDKEEKNENPANLEGARLEGAVLNRAHLKKVRLNRAMLSGASLVGITAEDSIWDGAVLKGADLTGARLTAASLRRARLDKLKTTDNTGNPVTIITNLIDAKLEAAYMQGANLEAVNLEGASLKNAHLEETNLEGANLKAAFLEEANLEGTDLNAAHPKKTRKPANLEHAHLSGASLWRADLENADLSFADLRAVYLDGCNLDAANLKGADLTGAFLEENLYKELKGLDSHLLGLKAELPKKIIEVANVIEVAAVKRKRSDQVIGSLLQNYRKVIDLSKDRDIEFGQYPHDDKDDIQPIRWRVLRREYDKVLLTTEELIDCHRYHDTYEPVKWEECSLRKWLNEEFLFKAFPDAADRDRIALVCNQNPDNPEYGTEGGNPTWDRVFALSIEEAERYFPKGNDDRMATVTPYAGSTHDGLRGSYKDNKYQTSYGNGAWWWWLRSPSDLSNNAANVAYVGGVVVVSDCVVSIDVSVRPALWLNL